MYRILTPATAASVTSRIDSIALAFDLTNEIIAEEFDGAIVINNHADTMRNRSNLIVKSMYDACDLLGKRPSGIRLSIKTQIPMSRGLGSSASCINAGVMLAHVLNEAPFKKGDVLKMSRELFPEEENLEANLYGGLVITDRSGSVTKINVERPFIFTLIVPDYKVPSAKTRAHRLNDISYEDYCESAALSNLFTLGLTSGESRLVKQSFSYANIYNPVDVVKDYEKINSVCSKAGALGVFICGDGPAMAAVSSTEEDARKVRIALSSAGISATVKSTAISNDGLTCDEVI